MPKFKNTAPSFWKLLPLLGCVIFLSLYFVATLYYPGGSQLNEKAEGFSWTQNYWCDLLDNDAINGMPNLARPIAILAMIVLSLTLGFFWLLFPIQVGFNRGLRLITQTSGITAMTIVLFLSKDYHDIIINISTLLGLLALIGMFIGLRKIKWKRLFSVGLLIPFLIALNNLLYYVNDLLIYLPLVQKITFIYFLQWICWINIALYNREIENGKAERNRTPGVKVKN